MIKAIVSFVTNKVWPWMKAHPWQTVLFPLTFLAMLLGARGWREDKKEPLPPKPAQDLVGTEQKHEQAVEALHQQAQALLSKASADQVKEYERLKENGSPAEVAKWIDQF